MEERPQVELLRLDAETLQIRLAGTWRLGGTRHLDSAHQGSTILQEIQPDVGRLVFEADDLDDWDSALLTFLVRIRRQADEQGVEMDPEGLPDGVRRMLALARSAPPGRGKSEEHGGKPEEQGDESSLSESLSHVGTETLGRIEAVRDALSFLGEVTLAFLRFLRGRARMRRSDFLLVLQEAGPQALPIVGLLSFLIGLIMAYIGATQLERFGAEIYVADLVGLAMAREMGAVMTAIIMAGRTGAAFAAQLGTMQAGEEIDALRTLAFDPMEFLVLPRLLALGLMMPLLYVYSVLLGVLGGALVAAFALDLSALQYFEETREAMELHHCLIGLVKAVLFGALVALSGCYRGIRCGRSSAAVGAATTSAVVTAIIWIIATDAVLDVVFDVLGL